MNDPIYERPLFGCNLKAWFCHKWCNSNVAIFGMFQYNLYFSDLKNGSFKKECVFGNFLRSNMWFVLKTKTKWQG